MASPAPGTRLHDRYVLYTRIGVGGMGEVWHAHDLRLDRPVAIKLIPGASERQIRAEAQAAARLSHPHIAGIYDFGDTGERSAGYGYLVMELLTGQTLADRLAVGPMSWPEAADIASQVASALTTAHDQHIVHRDIKPANIMLTSSGAKVLDFGIAGAAGREWHGSLIAGTPGYTAPERVRGGADGPPADVYGLAVLLYESLTGALPRPIATWQDLTSAEFDAPVPMPTSIPRSVASVLAAALAAEPDSRPTAAAFEAALTGRAAQTAHLIAPMSRAPLTEPTIVTARPAGVAAVPRPGPAPTTIADATAIGPGRSPARVALIAIAGVAVLIIALVALSSLHKPSGSQNTASTAPTTTTSTTTTNSPSPSASSAADVPALLATLQQTVDTAANDGSLGHDQVKELSRRVQRINNAWQKGDLGEFRDQCQQLQQALNDGGHHGGKDNGDANSGDAAPVALTIGGIVNQLLVAAGTADH
jgi:serine/threonine-protein kinase